MTFDYFEMNNIKNMEFASVLSSGNWGEVDDGDCKDCPDCPPYDCGNEIAYEKIDSIN